MLVVPIRSTFASRDEEERDALHPLPARAHRRHKPVAEAAVRDPLLTSDIGRSRKTRDHHRSHHNEHKMNYILVLNQNDQNSKGHERELDGSVLFFDLSFCATLRCRTAVHDPMGTVRSETNTAQRRGNHSNYIYFSSLLLLASALCRRLS